MMTMTAFPLPAFGCKSQWHLIQESGPLNSHAPVYIPPTHPHTVLKEYPKKYLEETIEEAERQFQAIDCMPLVYGVYYDDTHVYIHMERLSMTVASKIEQEGIQFVYDNKDKFHRLWNTATIYDDQSMCRADNMMLTDSGDIKFIDAEKAEIKINGLTERERAYMCFEFTKSAIDAHIKHIAIEHGIDLSEMGRLYSDSGKRFMTAIKGRHFTMHFAKSMIEWLEKYETIYLQMTEVVIAEWFKLKHVFGLEAFRDRSISISLKTTHVEVNQDNGKGSYTTISFYV